MVTGWPVTPMGRVSASADARPFSVGARLPRDSALLIGAVGRCLATRQPFTVERIAPAHGLARPALAPAHHESPAQRNRDRHEDDRDHGCQRCDVVGRGVQASLSSTRPTWAWSACENRLQYSPAACGPANACRTSLARARARCAQPGRCRRPALPRPTLTTCRVAAVRAGSCGWRPPHPAAVPGSQNRWRSGSAGSSAWARRLPPAGAAPLRACHSARPS